MYFGFGRVGFERVGFGRIGFGRVLVAFPWRTRRTRYGVPGLPLSVTLTGVCGGVDLTSPSLKRNLNIF